MSKFKFNKLVIYRNSKKYNPQKMLWLNVSAGTGLFYISLPLSRYYFRLTQKDGRTPNPYLKNIKVDDDKLTVELTMHLPKDAIGNEFGRAVTSRFKFVFERNADYQKVKAILLKKLGSKRIKIRGSSKTSRIKKISYARGRKSRRRSRQKSKRSRSKKKRKSKRS